MSPKWIQCRTWVRGSMANLLRPYTFLGEKGKDGSEKRRELKERNAWHRCFYWSLPPPHSMIRYHPERTWESPLESVWIPLWVSVYKSTIWNQNIDEKFQCLLHADRSARMVGDVREYCVLSNHCYIQILDVSHDLLNGFVSGLPFSSPPPPSPI